MPPPNVRLVKNGVELHGIEKTDACFTSRGKVLFEAGEITAYGCDENGEVLCSHTLKTAGAAAAVTLCASRPTAPAKNDAVSVTAQIVDAVGTVCGGMTASYLCG